MEHRPEEEIKKWKEKDPIVKFEKHLLEMRVLTGELISRIRTEVDTELKEATDFAENSPFPNEDELLQDVYASEPSPAMYAEVKEQARELTMGAALNEALREEMTRDKNVILIGEDIGVDAVGTVGGLWPPTQGLCTEFPHRVIGTPISESLIVGAGVGAALIGMRPVVELGFSDFIAPAMDHIVNTAAKMRYNYGGKASVPMVVRAPYGATGRSLGLHHSQCPEAWLLNVPGLKMVLPSTAYDAKGLLKAAIRDEDPVIFFEHKILYALKGKVPKEGYVIPIGKADIKRAGDDVTVVTFGLMVHRALSAAEKLQEKGLSVEIVDLRTLRPIDKETVVRSVEKTHRLVIAIEAPKTGGIASEISAIVAEEALEHLDAPIVRVAAPEAPVPFSPPLEKLYAVDEEKIVSAVRRITQTTT
jgi:pyruvate/2-oxoglutarate/acetoin dehydrogenase E1 component